MNETPQFLDTAPVHTGKMLGKTGLFLLIFVIVLVTVIVLTGWREVVESVRLLSLWQVLGLCGLAGLHYLIRAFRWHSLVVASGARSTLKDNAFHFFGGFAMTATPGRLGELVRLRWLQRVSGQRFGNLLPIAFADRAIELGSMVLVIAIALISTNLGTNAVWWLLAVAVIVVWVACRPRLLGGVVYLIWRLVGRRKTRLFARLRRLTRRLVPFMKATILFPILTIGAVGWALEGFAFFMLLDWLGASVSFWTATAIFLAAVLSGALSGLPGGLGGTEASAIALLLLQGVAPETAVLATAIIRITTLWFAVLIGLLVFPVAEMRQSSV